MQVWFFTLARWQRAVLIVALLSVIIHSSVCAYRRTQKIGDYDVHRVFGQRFLAHAHLYEHSWCYNYMPISAMYYAPLARFHPSVGTVLRYFVALLALAFTLYALQRMVAHNHPSVRPKAFLIGMLTIVLGLHYVIRDLDDGGPHLILLGMLVGGIYCAWLGRNLLAATWFGLAIALKMTPGLILPFLLWKRRWRLAALTTVATCAWIVLPALWMGPQSWWQHQNEWNRIAFSVFNDRPDLLRDKNELRVQNQSLERLVMRALVSYPAGHPLWLDHPGFASLLDLDLEKADQIADTCLLLAVGLCAWFARRRYCSPQDPNWLLEMSGVLILTLLLSPVTWLQHVVFILPALYLIVAQDQAIAKLPRGAAVAMWLFVFLSLGLNRELLGRDNYLLLLSYQMHTICMLIVLGVLLWTRPTARISMNVELAPPFSHSAPPRRAAA